MLSFSPQISGPGSEVIVAARNFVNQRVRPSVVDDDRTSRFRRDLFDEVGRMRLQSLTHPKAYGGLGLSSRLYYPTLLEIARGSMSFSVAVSVTNLVQGALAQFGSPKQKDTVYRNLVEGRWLGAFSLSEPQSGSDAAALQLKAKKVSGGYLLNGTKCWCSNAGHADVYLVMCRTGEHRTKGISSVVVPKDTQGFRVGKMEKKLGLHGSTLAELIFEDCFIPEDQRVGDEGQGFEVALSQLDAGRISIGAVGLAASIEAIEHAWRWGRNHPETFSEASQQLMAERFAEAQAIYALMSEVASQKDAGQPITAMAAQVKLLGSELAMRTASEAVEVMGLDGAKPENHVERIFRDAKALQIVEGTSQIQRLVLVRELDSIVP